MSDNKQIMDEEVHINRPKPVATQVAEILRNHIRKGQYDSNDQLPSEPELSQWLGVSRATIRTALAALAAEGLIIRKRGVGTFVNKRVVDILSSTGWDFSKLIEKSGRTVSINVHCAEHRFPTKHEALVLKINKDQEVLSIIRTFEADGLPAFYSTNVLPVGLVQEPYGEEAYNEPIFYFLEKYCGEEYSYCVVDLNGAQANNKIAKFLHIETGTPIIKLEEVFYNNKGLPLFWALNYVNSDVIQLRFIQKK